MELKQELGIPHDLPVVLFSGKLSPVKRPMDLLKAFQEMLKTTGRKAALVYLGDGELRPELERYRRDEDIPNVYFAGFQNQSELPRYFVAADIFVLPSRYEPWGLVVNEAMCFGLPVIVSDQVGAGGDIVRSGVNGFICPTGDVSALAAFLGKLLSDSDLRMRMGTESRKIIQQWNYQEDVKGVLACLKNVVYEA